MTKINKEIAVFIVFLILVILWGLFIKEPADTKAPVREQHAGGLLIEFENGTTEPEVKAILEKHNLTVNYTTDYNVDYVIPNYYIKVDKDEIMDVRSKLRKVKNWTEYAFEIKKGDNYIITVHEEYVNDKNFLKIIDENNLKLKKSVWCYIRFGDGSKNWISETDARRTKNELETNEKVLTVNPDYAT
jgi:hypothetical protein